jgi:signal transduction histidine kinase
MARIRDANQHLVVASVRAQQLLEEAEQTNRVKDEFLATVSHEFRTPLNAILGWARVLESTELPRGRAEHAIAAIGRSASVLAHMVDDLLDTARILKGSVRLAPQPVDLAAVTHVALDAVRPLAAIRNVQLAWEAAPDCRPVSGDADRLQQVFWNLLSNAVKFTPAGGRVHVSLEPSDGHMEVRVTDTGLGISQEFLPHVFERFRQADDATTRRHTGLGLGLGIVRQLVELHGGTVRAASPGAGQGATFSVRLPVAAAAAQGDQADALVEEGLRPAPRRGSSGSTGCASWSSMTTPGGAC